MPGIIINVVCHIGQYCGEGIERSVQYLVQEAYDGIQHIRQYAVGRLLNVRLVLLIGLHVGALQCLQQRNDGTFVTIAAIDAQGLHILDHFVQVDLQYRVLEYLSELDVNAQFAILQLYGVLRGTEVQVLHQIGKDLANGQVVACQQQRQYAVQRTQDRSQAVYKALLCLCGAIGEAPVDVAQLLPALGILIALAAEE